MTGKLEEHAMAFKLLRRAFLQMIVGTAASVGASARIARAAGNDAVTDLVAEVDLLGSVLGLVGSPKYIHQRRAETRFIAHTGHVLVSV